MGGWVVYGENFGIYRYQAAQTCEGVQLNVQGGVFAQFNLSAPSYDLMNADYVVGLPLTFRFGAFSGRFRLYHQSSHLGDEFLLGNPGITRVNLSFEEIETLLATDWSVLRVYGGAGWMLHREPALRRARLHYGLEWREPLGGIPFLKRIRSFDYFVAGGDLQHLAEHNYDLDASVKAGVELASDRSLRRFRILATYYHGHNPFGQFYDHRLRAIGVELNFGF